MEIHCAIQSNRIKYECIVEQSSHTISSTSRSLIYKALYHNMISEGGAHTEKQRKFCTSNWSIINDTHTQKKKWCNRISNSTPGAKTTRITKNIYRGDLPTNAPYLTVKSQLVGWRMFHFTLYWKTPCFFQWCDTSFVENNLVRLLERPWKDAFSKVTGRHCHCDNNKNVC